MSKVKYINVITGNKVTEDQFKKMSKEEQSYYDKISSVKKARAVVVIEDEEG